MDRRSRRALASQREDRDRGPDLLPRGRLLHPRPRLRVGNQPNGNDEGLRKPLKAWVGDLAGEVRIFDISGFVHDAPRPIPPESIVEIAKVQAGRNITSMSRVITIGDFTGKRLLNFRYGNTEGTPFFVGTTNMN